MLKLITAYGQTIFVNGDQVVTIISDQYKEQPAWYIHFANSLIVVYQKDYPEDMLLEGLNGNYEYFREKYNEIHQTPEEKSLPDIITQQGFKYSKSEGYSDDFIDADGPCYFIDGDPSTQPAKRIPNGRAWNLYDDYDFDDPVHKLSWIEINGNLALLFNNKVK